LGDLQAVQWQQQQPQRVQQRGGGGSSGDGSIFAGHGLENLQATPPAIVAVAVGQGTAATATVYAAATARESE